MTNEELHALAATGLQLKLAALEQELAVYHKEWPHLFQSATPPQLLKADLRATNGNGEPPTGRGWTPARRAAQALRMKRRAAERHATVAEPPKPKRTLSAATRRKLALAMKRRHASGQIARAKQRAAKERATHGA